MEGKRCMLALIGVAWMVTAPCGGTPVRSSREDPRRMGGRTLVVAHSAMGRGQSRSAKWETESAQPSWLQPSSLDCHGTGHERRALARHAPWRHISHLPHLRDAALIRLPSLT